MLRGTEACVWVWVRLHEDASVCRQCAPFFKYMYVWVPRCSCFYCLAAVLRTPFLCFCLVVSFSIFLCFSSFFFLSVSPCLSPLFFSCRQHVLSLSTCFLLFLHFSRLVLSGEGCVTLLVFFFSLFYFVLCVVSSFPFFLSFLLPL